MSKIAKINLNEVEIVDMTAEEIAQRETDIANAEIARQAEETAKAQKEADALAGNNKLLELGLTQAQVTAMTGYTPPVSE
jgi:predicted Mrr-cat superfamily restriction endonuclease